MLGLVVSVLAVVDAGSVGTATLTPADLYSRLVLSSVRIDTSEGQGSGVVVAKDLIATNAHVVLNAETVTISQAEWRIEGRVVATDTTRDVALVSVPGLRRPSLKLRAFSSLRVGERVYALGSPEGLDATFSDGLLSALRTEALKPAKGRFPIQTSAPISGGSSGGGLFDQMGRLVGLTTASRPGNGAQNLNWVIPTDWIEDLRVTGGSAPRSKDVPTQPPRLLRCLLTRKGLFGDFSAGLRPLKIEPLTEPLFISDFGSDVAKWHPGDPIGLNDTQLALEDIQKDDSEYRYAPAETQLPKYRFRFDPESDVTVLIIQDVASTYGRPRTSITFGTCLATSVGELEQLQREIDDRRQRARPELVVRAQTAEEACSSGDGPVCQRLAAAHLRDGSTSLAVSYLKKACEANHAPSCFEAAKLYASVGDAQRSTEMNTKACALLRQDHESCMARQNKLPVRR